MSPRVFMTKLRLKSNALFITQVVWGFQVVIRGWDSHLLPAMNEETHLGLQRSHCRKNIPVTWFPPKPWSYYPTLLPFQGQEIPTAFSYQLIPKFCVGFSQFIPTRNQKSEDFKKWWNVMNWREKIQTNLIFKV